jgi:hypothetical protein
LHQGGKERLSTIDLLLLISLGQLIFIPKTLFTFVTKQATLLRRSTVLILPAQLVFHGIDVILTSATFTLLKRDRGSISSVKIQFLAIFSLQEPGDGFEPLILVI